MADQPGVNKNSVCLVGEGGGVVRAVNQRLFRRRWVTQSRNNICASGIGRKSATSEFLFRSRFVAIPRNSIFRRDLPLLFFLIEWPRGTASMELLEPDYVNVVGLRRMANGDREHCWIEE